LGFALKQAFTAPAAQGLVRAALLLSLLCLLATTPAAAGVTIIYTDINADLAAADKGCAKIADPIQKTDCYNTREHDVWLKHSPESIDVFDLFCARRTQLINALSSGAIGLAEYNRNFRAAQRRLVVYRTVKPAE
jgi:hypothetical protein